MPTREWKAATSCGRAVIWIFSAVTVPMVPPIRIAKTIMPNDMTPGSMSVVMMAMAMPMMAIMLPRRAVTGDDRPRSARMNSTEEMR